MPHFFIERPIFAWVIAILITLGGVLTTMRLGIESYPQIAPPQVVVSATYAGASADTVEKTVTQVIEQQLNGIDNLLYFSSTSNASGNASITLTFQSGTDPDIAQVQTQNRVSLALPRLPSEVTQQGVVVAKANAGFLMVAALKSDDGSQDSYALNNIISSRILDQIQRIAGVGSVTQFGSEYAMRIWLDPDKLQGYGLAPGAVLAAIRGQNVQFASGAIGSTPTVDEQGISASVMAEGRFTTPEQFENIVLRTAADGTTVRIKDIGRVELGPFSYGRTTYYGKNAIAGFAVQLLPGANALQVSDAVKKRMDELQPSFPAGVSWFTPYDSTTFVRRSIFEVVETLAIAVVLVFVVMLVFLQNLRATIIPTLVIPVALAGTFLGMYFIGFTINQLSLFAMVLAIGIVVDDAIVVIENVERIMSEEHLSPKEATRKAMGQITSAVIAITVVLAAVFIPSAMQGGSVGAIYRQFALTIAISMGFSALLALSFTPALCATLLKPTHPEPNRFFRWFNRTFDRVLGTYTRQTSTAIKRPGRWMILFGVVVVLCGVLFTRMPGSFVPEEDQGYTLAIVQLPAGASLKRTTKAMEQVSDILSKNDAVEAVLQVSGFSFIGQADNVGMAFIRLKPWDERKTNAMTFIQQANGALFAGLKDAQAFVVNLPTIQGLGAFGGFDMYLQDRAGGGHEALVAAQNTVLGKAAEKKDLLQGVRPNGLQDSPQLKIDIDRVQAQSMGLAVTDVFSAIQLMLAPVYANDFFYQGRVLRVVLQADAPFRMSPEAFNRFFLPSSKTTTDATGNTTPNMIPLSSVVSSKWIMGPPALVRFNGYSAIEIVGSPSPGRSSGEAMKTMQDIIEKDLPPGFGFDWAGQSLQEIVSGNQAPLLFALSILVVFLCLAALYESWSIPVSVMLIVPLGVLGAVAFSLLRGLPDDVYFKIGLITIIGLAAKNAILIIEFAVEAQRHGKPLREAVIEAGRLRMRPILMTSFAFILGVLPLAVSSGAGANARHAIGTGVIGGMVFATFLGLLFVPIFYVAIRRMLGDRTDEARNE
ncbi:MAG TPA: multidrug efflux RND transporter permease subunit [Tahibacter sp.]|uniref:multidrug efflux RND transporter permease subunit n=1 Tax=Tahibacter sp. TaxID=2056211 RepID=UPI002C99FD06|nr:multidrug efflux RND transporter permease subunit [Tahibacter sp.]HSX58611.1 multidrug efflux RND transporter permease subunit [Tahibacter sp.]